jgi:hypothetical protein
MKVQIEIEIPDGHELVSHRLNSICDNISHGLEERAYYVYSRPAKPFVILGKPADWPEWLTADYVAKDKNEKVFGYVVGQPYQRIDQWESQEGNSQMLSEFTAIDIPGDWTQSLRENPNHKNKEASK